MTGLADYAPGEVFNGDGQNISMEELNLLNKALDAGNITGQSTANLTTTGGAPLKVESLEKTLKIITFQEESVKLWKSMPIKPAYNTVEEFNQLSSYGTERGGFNMEGELPLEENSTYIRKSQLVKFLGVTRSVTHPLSLVNTMVGNVIEREIKNGTLYILRKMSRALTRANSDLIPIEFNGLYAQHLQNDVFGGSLNNYFNSEVVVDLRGGALSESAIENAAEGIVENFGLGTKMFAPPKVLSKFVQNFYGNKFIPVNGVNDPIRDGVMGQRVQEFQSQYGAISLDWDIFMNPDAPKTTLSAPTSTNAPTAPGATSVTPVASDVNSKWGTGDAGNYFYGVTAGNRFGDSAMTVINGAVAAIVSGGAADIAFTNPASTNPATYFTIYRSVKNATVAAGVNFYPLFQVSTAQLSAGYDGGAAGVIRDENRFMPNTASAFLIQMDSDTVEFAQLAPLMKMDLAILSPAMRFMILLYGTPLLYAPKRMVRFINCSIS